MDIYQYLFLFPLLESFSVLDWCTYSYHWYSFMAQNLDWVSSGNWWANMSLMTDHVFKCHFRPISFMVNLQYSLLCFCKYCYHTYSSRDIFRINLTDYGNKIMTVFEWITHIHLFNDFFGLVFLSTSFFPQRKGLGSRY